MNEQQLRSVIRQILKESQRSSDIVLEYGGTEHRGLLGRLIDPFKDVAKAVALTGQDVLNSLGLMFDTLTTLSPAKLKKAREEYKKRNSAIGRQWEPIMRASDSAISNSDLGLILFASNPSMFLGAKLGQVSLETITSIPEYLADAGWEIPLLGAIGIVTPKGERDRREKASTRTEKKPLQIRLKNIFYGASDYDYSGSGTSESRMHSKNLINEDNEKPKTTLTSQNFGKQLDDYLDATGFDSEISDLYDSLYDSKKEQVDSIMKDVSDQLSVLKKFANAKSFKDFDDVIKNAKSVDVNVNALEKKLADLKSELEKKAADLRKQLESSSAKDNKKMTSEEIDSAVNDAASKAASEALSELISASKDTLQKSLSEMRNQVEETLTADWPEDKSSARSRLSKTAEGKKYLALIDGALDNISNSKETP